MSVILHRPGNDNNYFDEVQNAKKNSPYYQPENRKENSNENNENNVVTPIEEDLHQKNLALIDPKNNAHNENSDEFTEQTRVLKRVMSRNFTVYDLMKLQAMNLDTIRQCYEKLVRSAEIERNVENSKVFNALTWRPWEYLLLGTAIVVAVANAYFSLKSAGAISSVAGLQKAAQAESDKISDLNDKIAEIDKALEEGRVIAETNPTDGSGVDIEARKQALLDQRRKWQSEKAQLELDKKDSIARQRDKNQEKRIQEDTSKKMSEQANAMKAVGDALLAAKTVVGQAFYDSTVNNSTHFRQVESDRRSSAHGAMTANENDANRTNDALKGLLDLEYNAKAATANK